MTWYKVLKEGAMKDGDLFKVTVEGKEVLLIRDGNNYYATSHLCTHEDYDLSEGFMDDHQLICPNHFATFKPSDGSVLSEPEGSGPIKPLSSYKTKVEGGEILVEL